MSKIFTTDQVELAAELLKQGEIIAFPTETVYGLGCDLFSEKAIARLFEIKKRGLNKPITVHMSSLKEVEEVAEKIPDEFYQLASFLPGPLTIILLKNSRIPNWVMGGKTVGIRIPSSPIAQQFLRITGPIGATSANISGEACGRDVAEILQNFPNEIAAIIDGGRSPMERGSTVISLVTPERPLLLREGSISKQTLENCLRKKIVESSASLR